MATIYSSASEAVADQDASDLHVFSNNCGVDDYGLGILLAAQVRAVTAAPLA